MVFLPSREYAISLRRARRRNRSAKMSSTPTDCSRAVRSLQISRRPTFLSAVCCHSLLWKPRLAQVIQVSLALVCISKVQTRGIVTRQREIRLACKELARHRLRFTEPAGCRESPSKVSCGGRIRCVLAHCHSSPLDGFLPIAVGIVGQAEN